MSIKIKKRSEIDKQYKWHIDDLVKTDAIWENQYTEILKNLETFSKFKDNLNKGAENLLKCLETRDLMSEIIDKLYVYAQMKFHEDTTNDFYQGLSNKSDSLIVNFSSAISFIEPEIISLGQDTIKKYIESCPELKLYEHYFDNLIRQGEHILSPDQEQILANVQEIAASSSNIYSMLNDADMKFGLIKDENQEDVELTQGRYISFLQSSDRKVRQEAFNKYYEQYISKKYTLSAIYSSSVKSDVFFAKTRNYKTSLEQALSTYNIPIDIYTNLISTVNENLHLMHKYISIRKKALGVEELHMYDLYTPIVKNYNQKVSYDEAKKTVLEALSPLGEDYIQILEKAFNSGWIDVYENEGKHSGAYSWGAYGTHPFVLLNFDNKFGDMFTLAHEMGHAMHSYYTWDNQPFIYANYTIFLAEIASTVNETLLINYLLKQTTIPEKTKYLLNYFMEQFRGTLFRQTMFAEFEMITHDMVENGTPLTLELLNNIYHDLNAKYYGPDVIIDKEIDYEWARIPHFYTAFYVYQYATGYSAAISFSKKILENNTSDIEKYKNFLKSGSKKYSIDILKDAGLDMTAKEPIQNALSVFEDILNKFEKL